MPYSFFSGIIKNGASRNNLLTNIPQGEIKNGCSRPAVLICEKIHDKSPVYNLPNNKEFFIGSGSKNDLCLQGEDVSDVHAKIRPEKDGYILYDLASKSGLTVNLEKTLKRKLEHKDRIKIGSNTLFFEFVKEEELFDGLERRKENRIVPPMTLKMLVNINDKLEEVTGKVENVNLNGAKIEMQKGVLHKGNIIEAGISSSELQLVEFIAQVIWERVRDTGEKLLYDIGIQFLEMDEKSRNRLKEYLTKVSS